MRRFGVRVPNGAPIKKVLRQKGFFYCKHKKSRDSKPKGPERPENHEFPDHEKNSFDLDFLLLMSCAFLHEFPFFKIKQQVGDCFTRYLQRREKQFPDKQFFYLLRNRNECRAWILKHLQYRTSHMALKKSNLGIHDASKHLNREINSQLDQIIFDLGIHNYK